MFLVTSFPWDYECFIINSLIYVFMKFCLPSYAFQTNMMCYIITVLTCILIIIFDRFMVYLLQLVLQSFSFIRNFILCTACYFLCNQFMNSLRNIFQCFVLCTAYYVTYNQLMNSFTRTEVTDKTIFDVCGPGSSEGTIALHSCSRGTFSCRAVCFCNR